MLKEKKHGNLGNKAITLLSAKDAKKYAGQYVCLEKFGSKHVVSADYNPQVAHRVAKRKGYTMPVILYVPHKDEQFIFNVVKSGKAVKRQLKDNRSITPKELERMWLGVNLAHFWEEVIKNVSKEANAYEFARAKSKGTACCIVFC